MAQEIKQTSLTIEIPFEEYKELLIIKGRYEELKSQQNIPWTANPRGTTITYKNTKEQRTFDDINKLFNTDNTTLLTEVDGVTFNYILQVKVTIRLFLRYTFLFSKVIGNEVLNFLKLIRLMIICINLR